MSSKTYLVSWHIDIDADSPEEAAAKALRIQRNNDPENIATVFTVSQGTHTQIVDLSAESDG